ncbi:hypothetical protein K7G98_28555, partial [Saccharothrix sp. MB29]|nr:hypothetical protein [Saccharothrix sp. MB29]
MAATVNRSTARQAAAGGPAVRVDVAAPTPAEPAAGEAQVVAVSEELDAAASANVSARPAELVETGSTSTGRTRTAGTTPSGLPPSTSRTSPASAQVRSSTARSRSRSTAGRVSPAPNP